MSWCVRVCGRRARAHLVDLPAGTRAQRMMILYTAVRPERWRGNAMKIATSTKALAAVAALTMALGAGFALAGTSSAGTVQVERTTSLPVIPADSSPTPPQMDGPAPAPGSDPTQRPVTVLAPDANPERTAARKAAAEAAAAEQAAAPAAAPAPAQQAPAVEKPAKPAADPAVLDDGCP